MEDPWALDLVRVAKQIQPRRQSQTPRQGKPKETKTRWVFFNVGLRRAPPPILVTAARHSVNISGTMDIILELSTQREAHMASGR